MADYQLLERRVGPSRVSGTALYRSPYSDSPKDASVGDTALMR